MSARLPSVVALKNALTALVEGVNLRAAIQNAEDTLNSAAGFAEVWEGHSRLRDAHGGQDDRKKHLEQLLKGQFLCKHSRPLFDTAALPAWVSLQSRFAHVLT